MKKQKSNLFATSFKGLLVTLFILTFAGFAAAQTYRVKVKADGRYLHENGNGDKLVSTRYQSDDDFTKFIFERQSDGSYRIKVKANGRYLHEDGGGDQLVSTRHQPNDDFTKFILVSEGKNTYRIKVKANGRYLHEDGGGDQLVSTRHQPNDDFTRFILEPVKESKKANEVKLSFINRTNHPAAIYWVNEGKETLYNTLNGGGSFLQPTYETHQWTVRLNGKLVGSYVATAAPVQKIEITIRTVEAGPIWNQQDAEQKCSRLSQSTGGVWTGQWRTTIQGQMSVCELAQLQSPNSKEVTLNFVNQSNGPVQFYWVEESGQEKLYGTIESRGTIKQGTFATHRWRLKLASGKSIGDYVATNQNQQRIEIVNRTVEAGPIWNQQDAEQKCSRLSQSTGGVWTGQWRTTIQGQMSVCEFTRLAY